MKYPVTPDGRYFVSKSRLWRCTNPKLPEVERVALVRELMAARRAIRDSGGSKSKMNEGESLSRGTATGALRDARTRVHEVKCRLGERGEPWWDDGRPDEANRHPRNTSYGAWWESLADSDKCAGIK
jgi:hypothetical protein